MVAYFAHKLQESGREKADASNVMVEIMAAQKVSKLEDDPAEALRGAMRLDAQIEKKEDRDALAAKMIAQV